MHQPQPFGILGIADEPVGAVGFEDVVVRRTYPRELGRVVGVAVVADRPAVMDLQTPRRFAARDPAVTVTSAHMAVHVGR